MTYYSSFVAAVPTANKQAYVDHAKQAWPMFKKRGALRMVECWGEDVPHGKETDFYKATKCKDDETPVVSFIEWPDREAADNAFANMEEDFKDMDMSDMPFDGMRMFWGGFAPIVDES